MAHKLPATESFADSAIGTLGARWTKPTLYWPCKAWLTGTTDPTGLGHSFVDAKLHDAYKAQTGLVTPFQDPLDASDVGRVAGAYVLRTDQRADVEVRLTHVFQNVKGDGTTVFMTQGNTYAGLGARIHGAAGTDFAVEAGYTEALRAPSGYWFIWGGRAAGGNGYLYFKFLKVVGPAIAGDPSTVTDLTSTVAAYYFGTAENFILPGEPQAMRFTVTTNGAVAELRGFYTPPATGVEEEVLSYDDSTSSGSTFLDAGHSGFWLGTEILDPNEPDPSNSYVMIHGATSFEVRDSADNIVVRDEWLRDGVDEMDTAGPDQAGRIGNVVTGQFTGDQAGASSSPDFVDRLVREASSAKLDVDSTPTGGFHIYTDPPSSLFTQSIGGNFTLGSGAGSRIFALCARMAIGPGANWEVITNAVDKKGYAFAIHETGSSTYAARIHRYSAGGAAETIATRVMNQSGDAALIAVNTPNAFQFDVENVNGGSASVGTVKLTCSIDGTALDGWIGLADGVSEATDGGVLDAGGDRVLSGTGIGFFAKSTTTDDIYVNSITRPVADVTLDEREQASIFIGGEKVGVTSTAFTVPFEWPLKTLYRDYGTRIRFESMHVHRHAEATNQRRGWKVRSDAAKPAEIATLRTFFADQDGVEKPYPWTLPDGESITAVLEKDSLVVEKTGPNSYGYEFETWETLGPDYPTVTLEDFNIGYIDAAVGGKERTLDPALGGAPLHPVWHFEDSFGAFTLTVNLSAAAPGGGMYVRYELGGTAVENTHYTVVSGSQSPVFIAEGGTTATFQISTMASGKWYAEKLLTIKLSGTTDGPLDPVEKELHVYIRPELYSKSGAPPLPSLQWKATTYSGLTAGVQHTLQIEKLSVADSHEDSMTAFIEVVSDPVTSDAVEGTDWSFVPNPQIAYGGTTLSPSLAVNATRNVLIKSESSASGKSLILNLWHDKDDETDKNRYTMTHVMDSESGDNIVKNFPREPADNAYGPVGIIPPKPWDYLVDPTLVDPFGGPVHVFRTREVAGGSGYHRKSFDGQIFCAGHEEGVTSMTAYTRFSMYVRKPTNYDLPRFIRFGIRDRGASLAAPQKPTGATHSQATGGGVYTTLTDTSVNYTTIGVPSDGTWEVNNLTEKWKATVASKDSATQLTLTSQPNQTYTTWSVNDWYWLAPKDGNYSGTSDGIYDQNYAVHFDTTFTGSGTISYDGADWGVTGAYATTANWNANSEYGIEAETIRDADGVDQNYLRLWIIHNEANADAIGNGQVRIWYPVYFGNGVDGSGETLTGNINKALGVFWPMLETSSGALTGAPGRYQPRDGYWWTPNGSAVIPNAGKRSTTLTWS